MPDEKPDEPKGPPMGAMSPQLRRFLGPARSLHNQPETDRKPDEIAPPEMDEQQAHELPAEHEEEPEAPRRRQKFHEGDPDRTSPPVAVLVPAKKLARAVEMQTALLIIGGLLLVGGVFYFGKKFESLKYAITSRNKPTLPKAATPDKFPNLSADDLVEQALAAEHLGNWQAAIERFIAAKRKNLGYRGILFHVGKLYYDHGSFSTADELFERAIGFGENTAAANHLRGVIAANGGNFPAAEGFFEAAANWEPFAPQHYYNWAEALRKDRRFHEAIRIYECGTSRADSEQEKTVYRFKTRMTSVEAGETAPLSEEIETKQRTAPLSADWLMTAAALRIHEGNINEALPLIEKAFTADYENFDSLFASCASDMFFASASQKYPEVARACEVRRPRK